MRSVCCTACNNIDLEAFVLKWAGLRFSTPELPAAAFFQSWLQLNWFFGPGLHCLTHLGREATLSAFCGPQTTYLSSGLAIQCTKARLTSVLSHGVSALQFRHWHAEDHFSQDDMQPYLTLCWKLLEMHASLFWLWVFHSRGLNTKCLSLYFSYPGLL